ncbi:unnamed protein product [Rhizophagus irregularis]|nr:unnamed protein product [Rhizophagus irregularis]
MKIKIKLHQYLVKLKKCLHPCITIPHYFDEDEPSSESQQQYSNIDAPLEPARPPNGSNNINGRHEHIVI